MRYAMLGLSLALTALLLLWVAFALAGRWAWRWGRERLAPWPPQQQAQVLFALQVGPLFLALGCVLGVLLPAYLLHEPPGTEEPYSVSLLLPSLLCLTVLSVALHRVWRAWRMTKQLLNRWQSGRERVALDSIATPLWRIPHPLPLIAVVGVLRPQLFVASHLLSALSAEELTAVLRHEQWHLTARDNLRRALFDFCQHGLFFLRGGQALAQHWYESVEMAADEAAARHHPQAALDLAAALVKIARLFPAGASMTMPTTVSTVLLSDSSLARRVQRLMQMSGETAAPNLGRRTALLPGSAIGLLLLTWLLIGSQSDALRVIHSGLELIVSHLP